MQFGGGGVPSVGVFFDASFDRIGDLFALAVLHGLEGKNEMRQIGLSVNRPDFPAVQFCDVVKHFYTPGAGVFGATAPLGMADGKPQPLDVYAALLGKKSEDGAPVYKATLKSVIETADPATVLRNALTASQPKNSIIVTSGSLATVSRLLALRGAKEIVAGTVRHLVIADPRNSIDAAAAERLFAEWPTPIFLCGADLGKAIPFPAASVEKDFATPTPHPLADAYREFGQVPYDAPTTSMDAALFGVRSTAELFKLSEPGTLRLAAGGAIGIAPSSDGKHRRLLVDDAQKDKVVAALTELASAPPRAAAGRRGARGAADVTPPVGKKKQ
jgi:hypothetical protein